MDRFQDTGLCTWLCRVNCDYLPARYNRYCDQVIHLSAGQITGRGTFEEDRAHVPELNEEVNLLGILRMVALYNVHIGISSL